MTTRNWNQAAWAQLRSLPNNKPLKPVGEPLNSYEATGAEKSEASRDVAAGWSRSGGAVEQVER